MSFGAGVRLGPYEIEALVGTGGMGEVYRARDTRLGRMVAVKVLSAARSMTPEGRERFEHEARAISALSHPNICALYDVGEAPAPDASPSSEPVRFVVMEYLQGETLAARLIKGALPLDRCLQYAAEIAAGLDAAHRVGIVHRDLKPANIALTPAGVKLLDFGLAKTPPVALLADTISVSPLTAEDTILGTPAYMSPEQLEGRDVDARMDVFAFGAVLYEMATGRRAFPGTRPATVISAVMTADPPVASSLRKGLPPALDYVITRCLAKDREERWQSARDVLLQLRWIAGSTANGSAQVHMRSLRTGSRRVMRFAPVAALAALVALVVAGVMTPGAWIGLPRDPVQQPLQLSVALPDGVSVQYFALSPDGTKLLFTGNSADGRAAVWVQSLQERDSGPVKLADNGAGGIWSPDGRSIAFIDDRRLVRADLATRSLQTIGEAPRPLLGSWGTGGTIVFPLRWGSPIARLPANGGTPAPVTTVAAATDAHLLPSFLPDGDRFVYYVRSLDRNVQGVHLGSLRERLSRRLVFADSGALYGAPGYLLFVREGALMAQRFDASSLITTGDPVTVAPSVEFFPTASKGAFTVSQNGVLAYRPAPRPRTRLVWRDRIGREIAAIVTDARGTIRIAPDDTRVLVARPDARTGRDDLWIVDLSRGSPYRLTTNGRHVATGTWSPDGGSVVLAIADAREVMRLVERPLSGGADRALATLEEWATPLDWSRDGQHILYAKHVGPPGQGDLWVLPVERGGAPYALTSTSFNELEGRFSPDGGWVAYSSDESGAPEVYVVPFRGTSKWQVSVGGGTMPRWGVDSSELFYLAVDGRIMRVALRRTSGLVAAAPVPMFRTTEIADYAMAADGSRFLLSEPVRSLESRLVTVVLNWPAGLESRD